MMSQQINKKEHCSRIKAKWVLENFHKIPYRICDDYTYDPKKQVEDFCNRVLNTAEGIPTTYKRPNGLSFGRVYAKQNNKAGGFQTLPREFRHTLADAEYYDLDIVNCHPVILESYCIKNSITCHKLIEYVDKRDEIINKIQKKYKMNRSEVKQAFLKITFGGGIDTRIINNTFINEFYQEIREIMEEVYEKEHKIAKYVKSKKQKNKEGSTLSLLLQNIEHQILMSADKFLTKNGYSADVLVYDGIMVRKNKDITEDVLTKMSKHCRDETGYKVKWEIKPMNEGYKISDEELKSINPDDINFTIINSDHDGAMKMIEKLTQTKDVIKSNQRYFIKVNGGIYQEDKGDKIVKEMLFKLVANMNFSKKDNKDNIIPYSKNAKGAKDIITFVLAEMPEEKNFYKDIWTKPLRKLCFKNGYWDFSKNEFIKWEDDDQNIITCRYVERDYNPDTISNRASKWVTKNIFKAIFIDEEQRNDFIKWSARALAGEYEEKTWAVGLGPRSCGKGVLTNIFRLAFGDYVQEFSAEELFFQKCAGDSAKRLGWTVPLEFARLYISNECKTEDDNGKKLKLDGNLLKTIASGGDEIRARKLFQDQMGIRLQGKMLLMMNEMVKVKPEDANETLTTFCFKTEFKNELTEKEQLMNIVNDDYKFQQADPNIKKIIASKVDILDAFVNIIINGYEESPFKASKVTKSNTAEFFDSNEKQFEKMSERFIFHAAEEGKKIEEINIKISETSNKADIKSLEREKERIKENIKSCNKNMVSVDEVKKVVQDMRNDGFYITNSALLSLLSKNGISKKKIRNKGDYYLKYCWVGMSRR